MTLDQVLTRIRTKIKLCGSQTLAASAFSISPQHLNDILKRSRQPGPKLLRAMGLEKVITYKELAK